MWRRVCGDDGRESEYHEGSPRSTLGVPVVCHSMGSQTKDNVDLDKGRRNVGELHVPREGSVAVVGHKRLANGRHHVGRGGLVAASRHNLAINEAHDLDLVRTCAQKGGGLVMVVLRWSNFQHRHVRTTHTHTHTHTHTNTHTHTHRKPTPTHTHATEDECAFDPCHHQNVPRGRASNSPEQTQSRRWMG